MTDKETLRREMRRMLKASPAGTSIPDELTLPAPALNPKTVFSFMPFGGEIDPCPLVLTLREKGSAIAIPAVSGADLVFRYIEPRTGPFVTGAFGIREADPAAMQAWPPVDGGKGGSLPTRPVLILVPGLAFTRQGERLGRGAGFYDRFLMQFLSAIPDRRNNVVLAGACRTSQIVDNIPVEAHDIRVDCLLTEDGCILC
jgi:5-formyltetrahydrofolate cyclo-ligase